MFDRICREHGIEHRLTKPNHPWTNGQVEHEPHPQGSHRSALSLRDPPARILCGIENALSPRA
jgi:transposase InsO family protein